MYTCSIIITLANLSLGSFDVMMGSIVRKFPNVTSGIYRAQTTCAHPEGEHSSLHMMKTPVAFYTPPEPVESVLFSAPSFLGQSSHFCGSGQHSDTQHSKLFGKSFY